MTEPWNLAKIPCYLIFCVLSFQQLTMSSTQLFWCSWLLPKKGAMRRMNESLKRNTFQVILLTNYYSILIDIYSFFRYENPEISLHTGMILREFIRYEPLAKCLLDDERFYLLFGYVEMSTFDIASDAFTTFKVVWLYNWRLTIISNKRFQLFTHFLSLLTSAFSALALTNLRIIERSEQFYHPGEHGY